MFQRGHQGRGTNRSRNEARTQKVQSQFDYNLYSRKLKKIIRQAVLVR